MPTRLTTDELFTLLDVGNTLNARLDLDTVLESVIDTATRVMHVEAASLILIDDETGDLLFHIAHGEKAETIKPLRMKPGTGIVGWVIQAARPLIVNDVSKDARFHQSIDDTTGFETRSILCVPVATPERLWGALELLNPTDRRDFDEHDQSLGEALASQAAVAIQIATLHRQIVSAERLATIGKTMAGLAHCIKNVLNSIQGGSYLVDLALRSNDPEMMDKGWAIVRKNNRFMQDLVLDMLTYSKDRKPEYARADLGELIEAVCDATAEKAKEVGVTLTCSPTPDLDEIHLDPNGIRRCLLNLVSNAVDACAGRPQSRVYIRAEASDPGHVQITVADNGPGIPAQVRERLFEEFFSTKGSKGTGLGLPVTQKIIQEHQGTITVASTVGKGTTFTITLPRHAASMR